MINKLSRSASQLYHSNQLPWIIIGIGIILRLIRYLYNPSLWFDESVISLDYISRPFSDIINPSPDYNQAYPYLFLIIMKFFAHVLGNSEYALRLFPFLSGILALFLFYKVAKHYLEHNAVLIALSLFAILDPLIFQSSNVKPYSGDVFFALCIFTFSNYIYSKELSMPRIIFFGITGAVIVWLSTPSTIVLAGVGLCLIIFSINNKEWSKMWKLSMTFSICFFSFIANYLIYIQNLTKNFGMDMKWMLMRENAYMPMPPKSVSDIKWFIELFFDIFNHPVGIAFTGIASFAFIIGCISMHSRRKTSFFIIISPLIVALLAGALHQYALKDRLMLFLLPSILLLISEGAEHIRNRTMQSSRIIGILFIVLLFFQPLSTAATRVISPFDKDDVRSVLKYVKDNWQNGDILYINYYAQYPFLYYSEYYPEPYRFNKDEYIIGIAPRGWYRHWRRQYISNYYAPDAPIEQTPTEIFKIYANDLTQLKGRKRVWVLFSAAIPKDGVVEEKFFIYSLASIGKQIDSFGRSGKGTVYLFDLSNNAL